MSEYTDDPDDVVTLLYCPGCEMFSLAGDVVPAGHPSDDTGDQLECPRCEVRLNAGAFHDYINTDAESNA